MKLDIRLPIGLLFLAIGALLVLSGLTSGAVESGPDPRINLWWGLLMMAFGAVMAGFARRRAQRTGP